MGVATVVLRGIRSVRYAPKAESISYEPKVLGHWRRTPFSRANT